MDKRIYLCLAHMSGKEQDFIREAFDTNWVVPLGPNVNGFEQDLETFVGDVLIGKFRFFNSPNWKLFIQNEIVYT